MTRKQILYNFERKLKKDGYATNTIKVYLQQAGTILDRKPVPKSRSTYIIRKNAEKKLIEHGFLVAPIMNAANFRKINREEYVRAKVLTDEQINLILESLSNMDYRLACEISISSGLRLGEVLALKKRGYYS